MKKLVFLAFVSVILMSSTCEKEDEDTSVLVTVLDANGANVGAGTIVHVMKHSPDDDFGSNAIHSEMSMSTNEEGIAEFHFSENRYFITNKQPISKFFTVFKPAQQIEMNDEVLGFTSLNIKYGNVNKATIKLK